MPEKRIEYIDIARGIGILLVVMGHNDISPILPFLYQVIYSFHIPLFFFLSGYFLRVSIPFTEFLVRRFNLLIKPFAFTLFLIYFTAVSFEKMSFATAIGRIVKSLYGSGMYIDWTQLWFLPHIFAVSLFAFLFLRLTLNINRYARWILLLILLGVGVTFIHKFYPFSITLRGRDYELYGLPFSLDLLLVSGFFFLLGNEIRQYIPEKFFENGFVLLAAGVANLALNYLFVSPIDFNTRAYHSFILNTVEAILGIIFILALSKQLELRTVKTANFFKYIGRISMIILIFHVPIQDFWSDKFFVVIHNLLLSKLVGFLMGVGGSVLIYELFIKANPVASFWFGRKPETAKGS